ncbi:tudor domain-containing protein 7-like isoform X2 [Limulus polyphemus]|uniref:Tudor domain-containing protein 7-like isoform X2 n=1 Tax=Limulus polyphemus TaxID=6850 RepID=A0ABM1BF34_LIMPO|nr:tudor domain-containing protein 7-like isoform X2 [Limulus polyphemus]
MADKKKKIMRDEVAKLIRAVLQSSKGGVYAHSLQSDYKFVAREPIPYKELGYPTLESLLTDMPDVVKFVKTPSGDCMFQAVSVASTNHIENLVARQKSSKTKSLNKPQRPFRRPAPSTSRWTPPNKNYLSRGPPPSSRKPLGHSPVKPHFTVNNNADGLGNKPNRHKKSSHQKFKTPVNKYPRSVELPPRFQKHFSQILTESVPSPLQPQEELWQVKPHQTSKLVTNSKTYKEMIEKYVKGKGLESAIYKTMPLMSSKNKSENGWVCTVKVADQSFRSYPNEKPTKAEAEEEAAKAAVEGLGIGQEQTNGELPVAPVSTLEEIQNLTTRLAGLVSNRPNGVWSTRVPFEYKESFQENLPPNWLNLLMDGNCVRIDKVENDRCILYPWKSYSKQTSKNDCPTPEQPSSLDDSEHTESDTSSISGLPDPLQLPEGTHWDVFVGCVNSSVDLAVRLLDYAEKFDELATDMELYYFDNNHPVREVVEGGLYAVKSDESWHRVQILSMDELEVECYFVDNGDTDKVMITDLQELEPKFLCLPFQAVHCQLAGLEDYAEESNTSYHVVDLIMGKTMVAEVVTREEPIQVILYDTSTEEDININEKIINITAKEAITPKLPQAGHITRAFLTHVSKDGDIFIQIAGHGLTLLQSLMSESSTMFKEAIGSIVKPAMDQMYCVKCDADSAWYRAVVTSLASNTSSSVEVLYVDYGRAATVPILNMCELEALSETLTQIPHQAIRCRLDGIPPDSKLQWSQQAVDKLFQLAPLGQEFILKVIKEATSTQPASVELFKRIQPTDELVSINTTLSLSKEIFRRNSVTSSTADKSSSSLKSSLILRRMSSLPKVKSLFIAPSSPPQTIEPAISSSLTPVSPLNLSAGDDQAFSKFRLKQIAVTPDDSENLNFPPLQLPKVPEVGEYFDLLITVAANPHNFSCQSWKHGQILQQLNEEMQSFYSLEENICDMHECLLQEGQFYAGKHNKDDLWYRVRVKNILQQDPLMVIVHFVDYGDFSMMSLQDLQPLWKQFRSLPCQAIHGSLADIVPLHGDWNPLQCFEFQKIVVDKPFVSVVRKKVFDTEIGMGSHKLELTLIDTSLPDKDILIHEMLIDIGMAKLKNSS